MKNQIKKTAITLGLALMSGIAFAQVPLFDPVPPWPAGAPGQLPSPL